MGLGQARLTVSDRHPEPGHPVLHRLPLKRIVLIADVLLLLLIRVDVRVVCEARRSKSQLGSQTGVRARASQGVGDGPSSVSNTMSFDVTTTRWLTALALRVRMMEQYLQPSVHVQF